MEQVSLSALVEALEKGTHLHICIAFLGEYGNRKTRLTASQAIHDKPVCKAIKSLPNGMSACYRCRLTVQKAVIRHRRPMAGFCSSGVYEYCRPVIYDDRVICVIYVGNVLLPAGRKRLEERIDPDLLATMETQFTPEDCVKTADILESYITFLFDRYGNESKPFDPLVENMKNYIRENLSYGFSMEELSRAFNYTPKYLGQVFKQRTGKTVKEYCNARKIEQAKRLLVETSMSIEAIAVQVGFNSTTYFDRIFHRTTGQSPQSYRVSAQ